MPETRKVEVRIATKADLEGIEKAKKGIGTLSRTVETAYKHIRKLTTVTTTFNSKTGKVLGQTTRIASTNIDKLGQSVNKTSSLFSKLRGGLLGVGFALLFGGMALKRFFTQITTAGVSAFLKLMQTTDNQSSAIQRLGVWWEYLKFTVGSAINRALEPLMPILIKVIKYFADLIAQHPNEVFIALTGSIAAFTLAMISGQGLLALASVAILIEKISVAGASARMLTFIGRLALITTAIFLLGAAVVAVTNRSIPELDRFGGAVLMAGGAIMALGLAFGSLPFIAAGMVLATLGAFVYFRKEIWNTLKWIGLWFAEKFFEVEEIVYKTIFKILNFMRDKLAGALGAIGIDVSGLVEMDDKVKAATLFAVSDALGAIRGEMADLDEEAKNMDTLGRLKDTFTPDILKQFMNGQTQIQSASDKLDTMAEASKLVDSTMRDAAASLDGLSVNSVPDAKEQVELFTTAWYTHKDAIYGVSDQMERYNRALRGSTGD